MNSLGRKLKLLNYDPVDIRTDEFYLMILKLEEEKIRLYKPKEREKINYTMERNYNEHILKYLKKLNINIHNINKINMSNDVEVRIYILNSLTTLALIDEYKDLICYDDGDNNDENDNTCGNFQNMEDNNNSVMNENAVVNFFELDHLSLAEMDEQRKQSSNIKVIIEQVNEIFKKNDIPLLIFNNQDDDRNRLCIILSALHAIKEKLKNKKKTNNEHYESLFNFNINVSNKDLKDFAYIIRYLFNNKLKERKAHIKQILNEIQILTYNPVIDIKQGKVGR
ncbi:hypothetical protein, conserved [Plasmodium gonderi]|uniref:RNA transcription, translation and transport factor protein n=1 Tax=Plasmodium gonderi TaxID=77519 RepID=A0A1Y1JEH5_PLAGO|nr:hypothetical protein, conserved [Plasmodium gonderi]GAW80896.1 hypothetical protein, conserved [Plasmodium gonderi]